MAASLTCQKDKIECEPKKCPLHTDLNVVYFCRDCQVDICNKCVCIKNPHQRHDVEMLVLDEVRVKAIKEQIDDPMEEPQTVEISAAPVDMGLFRPIAAGRGFLLGCDWDVIYGWEDRRLCLYSESGRTRLWEDRPVPAQVGEGFNSAAVTSTDLYLHSDGLTHVYNHELQHRPRYLLPHTGQLLAVLSDGSHAFRGSGEVTIVGRASLTLPRNCHGVSVAECRENRRCTAVTCVSPNTLIMYNEQGSRQFKEALPFEPVWNNAVAVLPGDRLLVAAGRPPAVHMYSASGLKHEREWTSAQLGLNARHALDCLTVSGNLLLLVTSTGGSGDRANMTVFTLYRYRMAF